MSLRSLMKIFPCVVSRIRVFCGSSPAGKGWAEAEAAHMMANSTARTRVMSSPGGEAQIMGFGWCSQSAFDLDELFLQPRRDWRWHKARNVATHAGDLPDQSGRDWAGR